MPGPNVTGGGAVLQRAWICIARRTHDGEGQGEADPRGIPQHDAVPGVDGAAKALDFYKHVFGATERMRLPAPGGRIGHAEISVGDSIIMLADEHHEMGARGPRAYGGTPVSLVLYVTDVDATVKTAVAAGAKLINPV